MHEDLELHGRTGPHFDGYVKEDHSPAYPVEVEKHIELGFCLQVLEHYVKLFEKPIRLHLLGRKKNHHK